MNISSKSPNKVDMSLDDIIKMNRQLNRKRQNPSGRRGARFSASNSKVRLNRNVQQLKKNRVALRAKPRLNNTQPRFNRDAQQNLNNRSALSVLRRARQTAVAAARAAADAASILQRTRTRQQLFDKRRNLPQTSNAARKRPNQNRNFAGRFSTSYGVYTSSGSYENLRQPNDFQNTRTTQEKQDFRQRSRSISYSRNQFRNNTSGRNSNPRWSGRNNQNVSTSGYVLPSSQSINNAEYLAQARALIQAQNERTRLNRSQSQNVRSNWKTAKPNRQRKNLSYYARFWDNSG